jgi:hypothetical protein
MEEGNGSNKKESDFWLYFGKLAFPKFETKGSVF